MRGVKFKTDDVISAVRTWLHKQDKEWYWQGIHALVSCWCKAVVNGDFVEEQGLDTTFFTWMCYFHDFWINIYYGKKHGALLSGQPLYIYIPATN
jgi:hypothetical protein